MNGEININYPNYEIKKYGKVNMKFGTSGEIQITLLDGNESVDIEIIDSLKQRQHSAGAKQLHLTSNENKRVKNNDSLPKGKEQFVKFQDCHASKTFI